MGARIKPRITSAKHGTSQRTPIEVGSVDVRDLQLSPCRRLHVASNLDDFIIIKVETDHGILGARMRGLLLDRYDFSLGIKFHNTITLWVVHIISKNGRTVPLARGFPQNALQPMAIKDIVAKHETDAFAGDKLRPNAKCIGEAARAALDDVRQLQPDLFSRPEELLDPRKISRESI